ncbi:putative transposase protein [Escherichia coli]|nr:putative transposase protein [Escherichia coli]
MIISEMQRKLATWAATDPSLRIQRLLRLITQPEWLAEAARITLSSKGAHTPGVDGVNKTMLQARLAVELQILRDELLSGHYQPLPARRVYIPKSNGKLRPLGIPALLASTGSTGDSYDNAMAESINGLYKAEVIHRKSWKNRAEVELATLTWVDWYNNRRLLERLGHTPPAEAEKAYYASIGNDDLAA